MLHFSQLGEGPPLIILHGLFGSGRNWTTIARALSTEFTTFSLDLRNHGDSPSNPAHSLADLTGDLTDWMQEQALGRSSILGHSMGGLTAMDFALKFPDKVDSLVIVDVAPRAYGHRHEREFNALRADISKCRTRSEVDSVMAQFLDDPVIRQFLQMNLIHAESGFRWKIPVEILAKANFLDGFADHAGEQFTKPALFIIGGLSDYVAPEDHATIQTFFPNAQIVTLPDSGHWPHFSHKKVFLEYVQAFFRRNKHTT
ncbi:MAG: alpha/beta fold hydrolase [Spirochaetia bacterium]|nr:alpha/beta fold hydrolase [Spirochaetia bacterium]